MDNESQRTDPRVVRTRQLLKNALIELLEEMDIEKISVNRIAERAGINRVTFYLHYRDLPDMLERMADEMVEDIHKVVSSHPEQAIGEEWPLLESLLKHIEANARLYKVTLTFRHSTIFTDRLVKLIEDMITSRLARQGGNPESEVQRDIALWYGSAALIGTVVKWLRRDMPYTPAYMARQITLLRSR